MNGFIMILSLVSNMSFDSTKKDQKVVAAPKPALLSIQIGMAKKKLLAHFGKPAQSKQEHNFYSGEDFTRLYYLNEACVHQMEACWVDVKDGLVVSIQDVKEEFIEEKIHQGS